jgi:hypothetical protein
MTNVRPCQIKNLDGIKDKVLALGLSIMGISIKEHHKSKDNLLHQLSIEESLGKLVKVTIEGKASLR